MRHVALDQAMACFWANGYEATSVQDLVEAMGINRGSLYATFGDKRSLFLEALGAYDRRHRQDWCRALAGAASGRAAILGAFEGAIAAALDQGGRDGCLLVNTSLELAAHDPEVGRVVAAAFKEMEQFFHDQITRAQAAGEIPARVDPRATAGALLALLVGLRVLARVRPEAPLLRAVAAQAAGLLG